MTVLVAKVALLIGVMLCSMAWWIASTHFAQRAVSFLEASKMRKVLVPHAQLFVVTLAIYAVVVILYLVVLYGQVSAILMREGFDPDVFRLEVVVFAVLMVNGLSSPLIAFRAISDMARIE